MLRSCTLALGLALLIGCDSAEDEGPVVDPAIVSVTVQTPSGDPVEGLDVAVEYELVGAGGGDRSTPPATLRWFNVDALGAGRYLVEWETELEEDLARFVVEASFGGGAFADVAEAAPEGAGASYSLEVEGTFDAFRLRIEDTDGSLDFSDVVFLETGASPTEFSLHVGYPNPFVAETTIRMAFPEVRAATLEVLDLEGRSVEVLHDEPLVAGTHSLDWRPEGELRGGVYRVRLVAAGDTASVVSVFTGGAIGPSGEPRYVRTALGTTDAAGRFASEDRARFPQLYDGVEAEYRDPNNVLLGFLRPSREVTLVLRDGEGREQRYGYTLTDGPNPLALTWDPE